MRYLKTYELFESESICEYVVPKNLSWKEWKRMRANGMTPAKYHEDNPKSRFKIVHGHKRGLIGKALPGAGDLSYEKAKKMHAAIAMNESRVQPIKNLEVYHGTDEKFDEFDFSKTAQGVIWFTDSIESIKSGGHGGDGSKYILTRHITLNNPAGWDEYENKSISELINAGYDGVILPDDDKTDYIVFDQKSIKNISK